MKRAVIYIRVSTDQQTEESQKKPCLNLCKEKGWEVIDIFADHAKSAYHNVKRKKYEEVLELVKKRKIKHIVVSALDRWTRKGADELKDTISYLGLYDVQLHSVRESWLELINIPGGIGKVVKDFMIGMVGWTAEKESKDKSDRVKTSKRYQKALKKGKVGRPGVAKQVEKQVLDLLNKGKSYSYIEQNVTYKAKYGKVKHVSAPTISKIKKSALEKGNLKIKGKNE